MTCLARLGDSTGLQCTRDLHEGMGHVYVSSSLGDAHDASDSAARAGDER